MSSPAIRGDSLDTLVSTTGATQLDVDISGSFTSGQPLTIRVRPRDNNGNLDLGCRGTVHFTSTDPAAVLPPDYTFTGAENGDKSFSTGLKFVTPGNQSVTAVDKDRPSIRGDSFSTYVYPATATHLDVDASSGSMTAGSPVTIRVQARNDRGDVDTGYVGRVHFTSTDPSATLPADYTFTAADNGTKFFTSGLQYATPGHQTISATDTSRPGVRGDSAPVLVVSPTATRFLVTTSASASPGQALSVRVRAVNDRGDVDPGYRGTVQLTSTDPSATLPANYNLTAADNGDHTFSGVKFATAGSQSVQVVDTANAAMSGRSSPTRVGAAAVLDVSVIDSSVTVGRPSTVRVTALTSSGNRDSAYQGTIRLTSTDPSAILPADYTFTAGDSGFHDFAVTFGTPGTQTVNAADTADASRRGADTDYVFPSPATHLEVQVFSSNVTAGTPTGARIRARNANGDIDTGYRGTVRFTSNDPNAILPPDYTFTAADAGTHDFNPGVTYMSAGSRTISAADTTQPAVSGLLRVDPCRACPRHLPRGPGVLGDGERR